VPSGRSLRRKQGNCGWPWYWAALCLSEERRLDNLIMYNHTVPSNLVSLPSTNRYIDDTHRAHQKDAPSRAHTYGFARSTRQSITRAQVRGARPALLRDEERMLGRASQDFANPRRVSASYPSGGGSLPGNARTPPATCPRAPGRPALGRAQKVPDSLSLPDYGILRSTCRLSLSVSRQPHSGQNPETFPVRSYPQFPHLGRRGDIDLPKNFAPQAEHWRLSERHGPSSENNGPSATKRPTTA
jgi:hypothetical protein